MFYPQLGNLWKATDTTSRLLSVSVLSNGRHRSRLFGFMTMADTRTPEQRSRIMRSVGAKNTGPELIVRSVLHREGYRFALHRKDLPGSPDVVLPKYRKIIFVHGCFWHGHGCEKGKLPKSRKGYWGNKIAADIARDKKRTASLRREKWSVAVVWQCQTKNADRLKNRLLRFVEN
jgi:DNA mismatch endonuclease (patch repair protein)